MVIVVEGGDIDEIVVAMENDEANIEKGGPRWGQTQTSYIVRLTKYIRMLCNQVTILQAVCLRLLPAEQHVEHVQGEHPQVLPGIARGLP